MPPIVPAEDKSTVLSRKLAYLGKKSQSMKLPSQKRREASQTASQSFNWLNGNNDGDAGEQKPGPKARQNQVRQTQTLSRMKKMKQKKTATSSRTLAQQE